MFEALRQTMEMSMASIHTTTQQGLKKKGPPPVKHRKVKSYDHDKSLKMINTTLTLLLEGDFSARIPYQYLEDGLVGEIATKLNKTIDRLDKMSKEFVRVSAVVANEGRLSERAVVEGAVGSWANKLNSLNSVIGELARPTKEIARVMRAVAAGDLSQKVTVEAKGEILEAKNTINTMEKLDDG